MRMSRYKLITTIVLIAKLGLGCALAFAANPTAAPWIEDAKNGNAHAQYLSGNAYAAGMPKLGIKQDMQAAFGWYMKAARQNHPEAQYQVAASYILGEGTTKNIDQARLWLARAAALGHRDARDVLAGFPVQTTSMPAAGVTPTPTPAIGSGSPMPVPVGPGAPAAGGGIFSAPAPVIPVPGKSSIEDAPLSAVDFDKVNSTITGLIDKITNGEIVEYLVSGAIVDDVMKSDLVAKATSGELGGQIMEAFLNVDYLGGYWPWWIGAIALGMITVGFWMSLHITLGVSSSWDRLVSWREDRKLSKAAIMMQDTPAGALESAMLAATMEQFGDEVPDDLVQQHKDALKREKKAVKQANELKAATSVSITRSPLSAHIVFLVCIFIGGFVATHLSQGGVEFHFDMGAAHAKLFGSDLDAVLVLLVGGILVGFGTRMAGGCSSGHGLSGCSRLQSGSLIGTMTFIGAAIAATLFLRGVI